MSDHDLYQPLGTDALRLLPLGEQHRECLRAACAADTEIWAIYPTNWTGTDFDASFDVLAAARAERRGLVIVVEDQIAGMTAWLANGPVGWSIEIGNTYFAPRWRGTGLNARVKTLMLDHAFACEPVGCGLGRVAFRVDRRNLRSQAAMRKLGAVEEGVLRRDRPTWTGHVRDTVCFSILREEWLPSRETRGAA